MVRAKFRYGGCSLAGIGRSGADRKAVLPARPLLPERPSRDACRGGGPALVPCAPAMCPKYPSRALVFLSRSRDAFLAFDVDRSGT